MSLSFRTLFRRKLRPAWGFFGLGAAGVCLAVVHLLTEGEGLGTVLEAFIVGVLAGVIVYSGRDLSNRALPLDSEFDALRKTIGVSVAFALLAGAIAVIWSVETGDVPDFEFMMIFAWVLGGVAGGRMSIHAAQSEEELAHNEELTKLLKVNERVLRHNLRNELSIVLGHAENLEAKVGDTDPDVEAIRTHSEKLVTISDRARKVVNVSENETRVEFSLEALVEERLRRFRREYPEVTVSASEIDDCPLLGHPELPLAIDEALENAAVHNDPGVEISVRCTGRERDDRVVLEIADTGGGLPTVEKQALLQAAETPLAHGQGLGLWLIYWTVVRSGGSLHFRENEPRGTVVEFRLPTRD